MGSARRGSNPLGVDSVFVGTFAMNGAKKCASDPVMATAAGQRIRAIDQTIWADPPRPDGASSGYRVRLSRGTPAVNHPGARIGVGIAAIGSSSEPVGILFSRQIGKYKGNAAIDRLMEPWWRKVICTHGRVDRRAKQTTTAWGPRKPWYMQETQLRRHNAI